ARALMAPDAVVVKAALKISSDVYNLLTKPRVDLNSLKSFYGSGLVVPPLPAHLPPAHQPPAQVPPHEPHIVFAGHAFTNVADMLKATGYNRTDLDAVLSTRFVTNNGASRIQIKSEKSSPASVQNDTERIHGLTLDGLDRLHRFTRLVRAVSWTILELDLVLSGLAAVGLTTGIDEAALSRIAEILQLQNRWNVAMDQNCALWGPIPTTALDPPQGSLFNRLFNFPPFVLLDGRLPKQAVSFVHSSLRASVTPLPADNTTHRLL